MASKTPMTTMEELKLQQLSWERLPATPVALVLHQANLNRREANRKPLLKKAH